MLMDISINIWNVNVPVLVKLLIYIYSSKVGNNNNMQYKQSVHTLTKEKCVQRIIEPLRRFEATVLMQQACL